MNEACSNEKTPLEFIHLLKMLAESHRELDIPDLHMSGITASELALVYFAQKRTNGV